MMKLVVCDAAKLLNVYEKTTSLTISDKNFPPHSGREILRPDHIGALENGRPFAQLSPQNDWI